MLDGESDSLFVAGAGAEGWPAGGRFVCSLCGHCGVVDGRPVRAASRKKENKDYDNNEWTRLEFAIVFQN